MSGQRHGQRAGLVPVGRARRDQVLEVADDAHGRDVARTASGAEPIQISNFDRTSIFSKFKAYLAIEANETYRTHFGFPIFFVPFVTTSASRMRAMMDELDRITQGLGSKMLIFKLANGYGAPGYLFNEPWERVGYDPILLSK